MENRFIIVKILVFLFVSVAIVSCNKDNDPVQINNNKFNVYIVNEGNFGHLNGSISLYNLLTDSIQNCIFESANPPQKTGDVVQSMGIANNKGFIIINGSNLVKIVNLNNFKQVAELTVNYPRYFLQVDSNKAYITNGSFAGYIQIVNLSNSTITDSIPVGNGPENLLKTDKYVYVANSGGWINDSTVSVIDVNTDKEIAKIVVGENPCDLVIDAESNIWVICKGYYDTNYLRGESKIVKINHSTNQVEKSFKVGVAHDNFESKLLAISDDLKTIYYQEIGGVYSLPVNASQLSAEPVIRTQIALYGLEVNPHNGDIYCFDPGDFTSAGKVTIYDKNGTKKHEVVAGIGPNGAVFN